MAERAMIGQTISHYQITAKLGSGGMGEVYLATDTRLNRQVAIKVLPEALSRDPDARARLLREAQAASKLRHPNILTIHSIEEAEGRDFIVMEYVEGTPLLERFPGESTMAQVLDIVIQIAEGLDRAHRSGVVHRDLKPANILVDTEGRARILDFGLAKVRGAVRLTQSGSTLGTVAYSSPEQIAGETVDHRADLFSLGVILYELLTRRLPFAGDHEAAIIYAITSEEPHPLARYNSQAPAELQRIVSKCLAKRAAERYQSAADMTADLRVLRQSSSQPHAVSVAPARSQVRPARKYIALAGFAVVAIAIAGYLTLFRNAGTVDAPSKSGRKMLVVLPFENLGPAEHEYFADGITEEITARLAGVGGLGVIARTSAVQYKKTSKPIRQIGEELGVEYLLEGTIRWQKSDAGPDRVRITPQLVRATDETHLWADVYDRDLTEVFDVQADVAGKVVEALNVALIGPERAKLNDKPTDNLEAYDYYLQANAIWYRGQEWDVIASLTIPLLEKAIALDPRFAAAHARLSQTLTESYWHVEQDSAAKTRAKHHVDLALSLDPASPEAHIALGSYYYHDHDYERALEEFALVEKHQPNNVDAPRESGYVRRRQGKCDLAVTAFSRSVALDPRSVSPWRDLADTFSRMRRYDAADSCYRRAIILQPENASLYASRAETVIIGEGDLSKARRILEDAAPVVASSEDLNWLWVRLHEMQGDFGAAAQNLMIVHDDSVGYHIDKSLVHALMHDTSTSRASADSARILLGARLRVTPDDPDILRPLAIAYAVLSRKDDAIRIGRRACEVMPYASDAYYGTEPLVDLALVYTMVGEFDQAIDQLEFLLSVPSPLSHWDLRLTPEWAPLRGQPRFEALLKQPDKVF